MYLSRLTLNPNSRRAQREIGNPYELHRTLMAAFPADVPKNERVLYRVDTDPRTGVPTVLVQSHTPPDWSHLAARVAFLLPEEHLPPQALDNPAVKPFDLDFAPGQTLAFRLRANPTVKRSTPEDRAANRQGQRHPLYREEDQRAWLARKGERHGFRILRLTLIDEGNQYAWKPRKRGKKRKLTHYAVRFEGVLQVADPDALWRTIQSGIGPAKSFGFGLLSLAPTQ